MCVSVGLFWQEGDTREKVRDVWMRKVRRRERVGGAGKTRLIRGEVDSTSGEED